MYLGLALFAEGPTDHRFLDPLLRRLSEDLCRRFGRCPIEVGNVHHIHGDRSLDRAQRISDSARESEAAWHVLFVHADADTSSARARAERVQPAFDLIAQWITDGQRRPVAVIPIRATEAWALVDGDALRSTTGVQRSDAEMGLPTRAAEVEAIPNPKHALEVAFAHAAPRRRRHAARAAGYLDILGERLSLERLREVSAFQSLESELRTALEELRYLA